MLPCSLEILNLESNQIIKIDEETFAHCQRLKEINLKGNPMAPQVSAPVSVFSPLRYLQRVGISWDEAGYELERTKRRNSDKRYGITIIDYLYTVQLYMHIYIYRM